jgi:hypothetical protein
VLSRIAQINQYAKFLQGPYINNQPVRNLSEGIDEAVGIQQDTGALLQTHYWWMLCLKDPLGAGTRVLGSTRGVKYSRAFVKVLSACQVLRISTTRHEIFTHYFITSSR